MEHGDLFERSFKTGKGTIRLLAEIDVQGTRLHLKDVVVFEESGKHVTGFDERSSCCADATYQ
ncbi:MAG TPA: hypothetical protein VFW87_06420 [Pirellulales bacterium]|nr:hypothetical protein [Pirellulales bacterium]